MDKIEIKVDENGIKMTGSFKDIVEAIFGKRLEDLPKEYETAEDYLAISELDLTKVTNDEQLKKLCEMLQNRIDFAKKHKDEINLKNVTSFLVDAGQAYAKIFNDMNYMSKACQLITGYIEDIKKIKE